MRHLYSLLLMLALPATLPAQDVTLDHERNTPAVGSTFSVHRSDTLISAGGDGTGQTWDLSTLTGTPMTWEVLSPQGWTHETTYPDATHIITNGLDTMVYRITGTGMELIGELVTFPPPLSAEVHATYSDGIDQLAYPAAMNTMWSDGLVGSYTLPSLGAITSTGTIDGHVDAHGTLQLPAGTFEDALRIHTYLATNETGASAQGTRRIHTWMWYGEWLKHPLMKIVADTLAVTFPATLTMATARVEWLDEVSIGIFEAIENDAAFGVWPTPAASILNVTLKEFEATTARASLIDLKGRLVREWNIAPSGNNTLDITGLAGGQYMLQVAQAGRILGARKVIIAQ